MSLSDERARYVRKFVDALPDREVIIVSHTWISHFLVNHWVKLGYVSRFKSLRNAEEKLMVLNNGRWEMRQKVLTTI